MKKSILFIFCLAASSIAIAQSKGELIFETEYQLKYSIGNETTQSFNLYEDFVANLPLNAKYDYPVNSIQLNFGYQISDRFAITLGSGIGFAKFESIPFDLSSYYDKLLVPVYTRFHYNFLLKEKYKVFTEIDLGYQYTDNRWGFLTDELGFKTIETGGALFGFNVGLNKEFKKFKPSLKLGYEFNQFTRNYLYTFNPPGAVPPIYRRVEIWTYYHLFKVMVSLKF